MDAIKLSVVIGQDRRLVVQLPDDTPLGPAEIVIKPSESAAESANPAREAAKAKLLAMGKLSIDASIPSDLEVPTNDELARIGHLLAGGRSTLDIINEDRGEY